MPTFKQCFQCGNDNPDQAFCGSCGSPLALNDYISKRVRDQLADTIQNRDVLEMDSSIKVFKQAWDWIKLILGVAVGLLVLTGGGVIWKASDFWSGVDKAKQSVVDTSKNSSDEITRTTSRFQQEISKQLDAGKTTINTASSEAARRAEELKTVTVQTQREISRQTASFRSDIESSRQQLQAASKLEPEMEGLRKQLAQANSAIQAQQKTLSSSEEFAKSIIDVPIRVRRLNEDLYLQLERFWNWTRVEQHQHGCVVPFSAGWDHSVTALRIDGPSSACT